VIFTAGMAGIAHTVVFHYDNPSLPLLGGYVGFVGSVPFLLDSRRPPRSGAALTPYLPVAAWWTVHRAHRAGLKAVGTVVMRNLRKTNPGAYKVIVGLVGFSRVPVRRAGLGAVAGRELLPGGLSQPPGGA
jgi:hypothetical protein